jgi:hypothetical protein
VAIVILAGVAAAALGSQSGSGGDHQGSAATSFGATPSTLDDSPANGAKDISEAAQIACRTNYQAVTQAVYEYEVLHGTPPADIAALASMLRGPVTSSYYTITLDPTRAGAVDVATPYHSGTLGDANYAYAGLG